MNDIIIPSAPWLYPEEQQQVVLRLLELGLLKFDNDRKLPLKKGGWTDLYMNLRDARNNPEATEYLARLFRIPLQRLDCKIFAEIPSALSGVGGHLSVLLGVPYLTFREEAKPGRVAQATVIGRVQKGATFHFLEDVIKDGASKIKPYHEAIRLGLQPLSLVVLVDRQQGWPAVFEREGIHLPVWSGMTLHDVRRELINSGAMQRCDPKVEADNRLIVALDGRSWKESLPLIDPLRTAGCIWKVNDFAFAEGSTRLIPELSVYGRAMLDFKLHDIPDTVERVCRRLQSCPPWAVTVHASGTGAMVQAARRGLGNAPTLVFAVTVLTSLDETACKEVYVRRPLTQVKALARIAFDAGADGLVCSPEEVQQLKRLYPDKIFVTPGVRPAGSDPDDQKRISTPRVARERGADFLVVGRPITAAKDPVQAVQAILAEMRCE